MKRLPTWLLILISLPAFLLACCIVFFVVHVQPNKIYGQSMMPNYKEGQMFLTNKFIYIFQSPKRGDAVLYYPPDGAGCPKDAGCIFIGRIVGLPEEKVKIQDGSVFIQDFPLTETYLSKNIQTSGGKFIADGNNDLSIPSNQYMILGDNRSHSSDSRTWGFVSKDAIIGKVWICYGYCDK